jgi:hypothetical protein
VGTVSTVSTMSVVCTVSAVSTVSAVCTVSTVSTMSVVCIVSPEVLVVAPYGRDHDGYEG